MNQTFNSNLVTLFIYKNSLASRVAAVVKLVFIIFSCTLKLHKINFTKNILGITGFPLFCLFKTLYANVLAYFLTDFILN